MADPTRGVSAHVNDRLREFRRTILTAMPGIVESYDPATRRARVLPALDLLVPTEGGGYDTRPRSVLLNVPVLHPAGGGFLLHLPLQEGDAVLLVFSARGLTQFKKTFARSTPDVDAVLSDRHAIAIPGFGALDGVTPVEPGVSLQKEDGTTSVRIDPDGTVHVTVPAGQNVHLGDDGGEELVTRTFLERYFNSHFHSSPMGPTGPPIHPTPVTPGEDMTTKTKGT